MISGILNIHKEIGLTSHDVVARVRRILHEKRVGHAGTLDPAAEGVLPVCIGFGTRVVEYLSNARKVYCAEIILGITSDTFDREGLVTSIDEVPQFNCSEIEVVLDKFRGKFDQIPPIFSAIKVAGKPVYKAAREGRGDEIELKPRPIEIFELKLLSCQIPRLILWVECSKGTYIRSLAQDIGQELGCGAYLHHLVRVQSGPFHLDTAITLGELEESVRQGRLDDDLIHFDSVLGAWPAFIVNSSAEEKIKQGRNLPVEADMDSDDWLVNLSAGDNANRRVYTLDGEFLALMEQAGKEWHPAKVFI